MNTIRKVTTHSSPRILRAGADLQFPRKAAHRWC